MIVGSFWDFFSFFLDVNVTSYWDFALFFHRGHRHVRRLSHSVYEIYEHKVENKSLLREDWEKPISQRSTNDVERFVLYRCDDNLDHSFLILEFNSSDI